MKTEISMEKSPEYPAGSSEDQKYKNKVLFLRKSKKGAHLYAFNRDEILGGDVGSLLMDISEVERLIAGSTEWIKVGIIPEKGIDTGGIEG